MRARLGRWIALFAWRSRWLLRPVCWWRGKHRGTWSHGRWVCRICADERIGRPPAGALMTDEPMRHVYQAGPHGELRRIDKVRGGKKARRRNPAAVEAVKRLRRRLLSEQLLQGEQGERR